MTEHIPLRYSLRFSEPASHLVDVTLTLSGDLVTPVVELWMPVWTPGSYLIREFSRHVQELSARDAAGRPLDCAKTGKNHWRLTGTGTGPVLVSYRVYGREMSVRTNWIEDGFALLNGAATFLTVRGAESRPHHVALEIPGHWEGVWTALDPADAGESAGVAAAVGSGGDAGSGAISPSRTPESSRRRAFTAPDLDTLIDSPVLAGSPAVHAFTVDDVPVSLVNEGEAGFWDGAKAAADVKTIVETYRAMCGGLPLDRYLFLNLITEGRGGLEHKRSSVLMTSRYAFGERSAYVNWLGLVSHEFFHVWNVKRSRPVALGPFDYEAEVYSRELWVAEGVTAYYTALVPCRAGLTSESEYLEQLSNLVTGVQDTPGRKLQSLEEAGFDAWIKLYRRDENTVNTTMSYYTKGAVVAWLLDTEIRSATAGARSLDDLMRLLFGRYAGDRGYTGAQVQEAAEEIADRSLDAFFTACVRGRDELDYDPALRYWGLRFREGKKENGGSPWLGIDTASREGKLLVQAVRDGGPARTAGLNVDDEILALGGFRVDPGTLSGRLALYKPGERIEVLVARRDAVRIVPVTLGAAPREWKLEPDPEAPREAAERRRRWLGGRDK
jgi:predicted metalloprotease with PDZ domain